MPRAINNVDLRGHRFGLLLVLERAPDELRFEKRVAWHCQCDCGRDKNVLAKSLLSGATKSCGCQIPQRTSERMTKHGQHGTGAYKSWEAAKRRCYNPNQPCFKNYGGRGIQMCDEWRNDFAAFLRDMGERPEGHTLDRVDPNGHYEPGNCRWASLTEQANNCRSNHLLTVNGETHTIAEWERLRGFRPGTLKRRILLGWTEESALSTAVG